MMYEIDCDTRKLKRFEITFLNAKIIPETKTSSILNVNSFLTVRNGKNELVIKEDERITNTYNKRKLILE